MISLPELARRMEQPTALRILHQLPLMLSSDNWLRLDQRALAHLMQRSQPTISLALDHLLRAGAIARTGRGPGVRYRLSPHVLWESHSQAFHNGSSATMPGNVPAPKRDGAEPRPRFKPRTAAEFRHDELQSARDLVAQARAALEEAVRNHSALVKGRAKASERKAAKAAVTEAEAGLLAAMRHMETTRLDLRSLR